MAKAQKSDTQRKGVAGKVLTMKGKSKRDVSEKPNSKAAKDAAASVVTRRVLKQSSSEHRDALIRLKNR